MFNKIEPLILKQQRLTRLVKLLIVISIVCFVIGIVTIPAALSGVFIVATIISIFSISWCRKRIDAYAQEIQQLRDEMKQTDLPPATIELVEGCLEKVDVGQEAKQPTNDEIVVEESICLDETKEVETLEEVKSQEEQTEALVEEQTEALVEEQVEELVEEQVEELVEEQVEELVKEQTEALVEEQAEELVEEQVEMLEEVTTVEEPVVSEVIEKTFDELILDQLKQLTNNENLITKTVGKYVDVISEYGKIRFKLTGRKMYMLATLSEDEANALSLKTEAPAKTEKYSVRIMLSEAKELEPLASYLMTILNHA